MQDDFKLHIAYKDDFRNFSDIYKFNDVLKLFTKKTLDTTIFFNFLYSLKEPDAFHIKRKELIEALKQIQEHEKNEPPFIELNGKRFNFSNSHLKFDEADLIEDELSEGEQQAILDILHGKKIDNTLFSKEALTKIFNKIILIKELIELIIFIISWLGVEPIQLLESPQAEFEKNIVQFCSTIIEVREVTTEKDPLMLRISDNLSAAVLALLDNGTRIYVLSYPKGNSPWLKVAVKDDNGETLVGYVSRKHTKKINIVITK